MIYASDNGHPEIVRLLLSQPGIEINCKDIQIQKSFIIFKSNYLMIFPFLIIYGIEFQYLIILLFFWLQQIVIQTLFNFYYHNQVLKSIAKPFEYKNHSRNLLLIIS